MQLNVKHKLPSGNIIDVDLVDFRGTKIDVGSTIVYVIGQNSAKQLVEAKVLAILPYDDPTSWELRHIYALDKKLADEGFDQKVYDDMRKSLSRAFKTKVVRKGEKYDYKSGGYVKKDIKATLPDSSRLVVIK